MDNKGTEGGREQNKNGLRRGVMIALTVCVLLVVFTLVFTNRKPADGEKPGPAAETQEETTAAADDGKTEILSSGTGNTVEKAEEHAEEQAQFAETAGESDKEQAAVKSPEMIALEEKLQEEIDEKNGDWSLYLYRFDTGEEIGINADEPMISASLIKLFIAGCYLEQVEKGEVSDDYQNRLSAMISASDNGSANTLIDLLGMEQINAFMENHNYKAGQLNRKMLEKNGTENYTSSGDCGRVLRKVYEGTYVNKEASERIMDALRAQIARNLQKIPAGVPDGVDTANKTGELFTVNADGINVNVQNDAAVIFAEDHPYVLVVMTAVPSVGEGEMHRQIAELSAEVYNAVCEGGQNGTTEEQESEESSEAQTSDTSAESATTAESEAASEAQTSDTAKESGTASEDQTSDTSSESKTASEDQTSDTVKESGTTYKEQTTDTSAESETEKESETTAE